MLLVWLGEEIRNTASPRDWDLRDPGLELSWVWDSGGAGRSCHFENLSLSPAQCAGRWCGWAGGDGTRASLFGLKCVPHLNGGADRRSFTLPWHLAGKEE